MEQWKPIIGYEGLYEVSNLGRVRSFRGSNRLSKDGIRRPQIVSVGYHQINLTKKGVTTYHYIHRLTADAFIPNLENKRTINHINGVKTDNRVDNLEWATHKENVQHAKRTGLIRKRLKGYGNKHVYNLP